MASKNSNSGDYGLKTLAEQLFGSSVISVIKNKKMTYRDIWELSSPTTQCANTIGAAQADSVCWLCGFMINGAIEALKPECEHVLPVGQALVFLDLYKHTIHGKAAPNSKVLDMLKLEYRWSHSVCNRLKSDTNFLGFDTVGNPVVLTKVIEKYLNDLFVYDPIKTLLRQYNTKTKQTVTKAVWITERIFDISVQLKQIIGYMEEKSSGLLLLSGVASLYEPENIAQSIRDVIEAVKPEIIPKINTVSSSSGNELRKLKYFLSYKNNLNTQITELTGPLSKLITEKFKLRDGKTFIHKLNETYQLERRNEQEIVRKYILDIIGNQIINNFDNVISSDVFKNLYYKYSYYNESKSSYFRRDLFNPFVLELIYMCVLCIMSNNFEKDISRSALKDCFNKDIDNIQQIWLANCAKEDYKFFFCKMTEMFINSGVISKDIVKCVSRIDCSSISKIVIEPANFIVPKTKEEIEQTMWKQINDKKLKEAEMANQLKQIEAKEAEAAAKFLLLLSKH
jgi:hypothetical protein